MMDPLEKDPGGSGPDAVHRGAQPSDSPRQLPKAPLVLLGTVFVVLAAALAGHVVLTDGDAEPVAATQETTGDPDQVGPEEVLPSGPAGGTQRSDVGATVQEAAQDLSTTTQPSTTVRSTTTLGRDPRNDLAGTVDIISDGFQEDFAGLVDEPEADCMAVAVVDTLGLERLWELTDAMAEQTGNPGGFNRDDSRLLTGAELEELNHQLAPCVSQEVADRLDFE